MCEINPARKAIYRLEFFTSDRNMTRERWQELVMERLLKLEMEFNATGEIRAHVHEEEK